ncbi:MAG TPA: hypothetical protein PLJ14_09975 [Accumulibacter sp.]|nr:hypothetical protein [Accumulibacter sp.]
MSLLIDQFSEKDATAVVNMLRSRFYAANTSNHAAPLPIAPGLTGKNPQRRRKEEHC